MPEVLSDASPRQLAAAKLEQAAQVLAAGAYHWLLQRAVGRQVRHLACVGPSLGELMALAGAGALSWKDAVACACIRESLMLEASGGQGAMASIFGLTVEEVRQLCGHTGDVVVANHLSRTQVVVSGRREKVGALCLRAHELSGQRPFVLPISVAAHHPTMERASVEFERYLATLSIREPTAPVRSSLTLEQLSTPDDIRAVLAAQLTRPVRWAELVEALLREGVRTFIGVGSAIALLKQIRRDYPSIAVISISSEAELGKCASWLIQEDQQWTF
jgi:[acyl-carrier-protein] S-malonyltransferase